MKLLKYSEIDELHYSEYIDEWEKSGELIVPAASKRGNKSFPELVEKWKWDESETVYESGFVPSTLYFYADNRSKIVGSIHLRHELNDRLLINGGHIGYGVKPSERGSGVATSMLREMLKNLWDNEYDKILITCDDSNLASSKTIENCGGVLLDKPVFEGVLTRRYWIYKPENYLF